MREIALVILILGVLLTIIAVYTGTLPDVLHALATPSSTTQPVPPVGGQGVQGAGTGAIKAP